MARRLVERGVRFVQIYIESQIWDNHSNLEKDLSHCCAKTDRPAAALLNDLKQRGLLDSTLVLWGGEFGRLPLSQISPESKNAGRDHGPGGFSVWLAGGGVKKGYVHGATDEIGYKAVRDPVSVHDFHATVLHLLGMDHEKLVYNHNGLNERLSGVEPARVVDGILL
jgi:arylsulfatase A-like enzyme